VRYVDHGLLPPSTNLTILNVMQPVKIHPNRTQCLQNFSGLSITSQTWLSQWVVPTEYSPVSSPEPHCWTWSQNELMENHNLRDVCSQSWDGTSSPWLLWSMNSGFKFWYWIYSIKSEAKGNNSTRLEGQTKLCINFFSISSKPSKIKKYATGYEFMDLLIVRLTVLFIVRVGILFIVWSGPFLQSWSGCFVPRSSECFAQWCSRWICGT
jgi:hypothetical protein